MEKSIIDNNDVIKNIHRLNEAVSRDTVYNAIKNKDVVFIYYAGDETINKGYRTIEPFVIGRTRAGNIVVRAWQQAGATDSGNSPKRKNDEIPGWRLFKLDGITSMVRTLKKFDTTSTFLSTNRPNYNPADKQMIEIYFAVQPDSPQPDQQKTGDKSILQPNINKQQSSDNNFFRSQAQKFKSFFQKPAEVSKAWIDDQKRKFIDIMKKPKQ